MTQIKVNPNNEMYYSEDFIKGFNEGAKRQFEADIADRKTENSSEIPNNCEDLQDWKDRMWAEAIVTEPTISKMEQVDKPQTCSVNGRPYSECGSCEHFKCTADEPQTERSSE